MGKRNHYDLVEQKKRGRTLFFSELKEMPVYSKDMKSIGNIVDVDLDPQGRVAKALVVQVDGK